MEVSENVKINFEERLNNLLNTRDITVYLECLLALREKYLIVAAVKDTTEHLGVKSLDASAKNRRIAGKVLDSGTFVAQSFDEGACTSGRNEFHSIAVEKRQNFFEPVLIVH